jgi:exodeoxyribonuclease V gamma subunit
VRARFAIDPIEIDTIRRWVAVSGIRWGVDGEQRAEFELPRIEQNTWRFGLERLFLGYAMTGEREGRLFAGRLPVDGVEGTEADLLGRLSELVDVLARFRGDATEPRSMSEWAERLRELVGAIVGESAAGGDELARLRRAIDDLGEAASAAGFDGRLSLRAVRERLAAMLDLDMPTTGFLSGGVTVCAMLPMRSIPFRVVCVLGLSDGAFPRSSHLPAFDRMARERRLGDRSPRDDDRFLFLEAILAARDRLIITYVGQSVHDNSDLPPSVVVSELLDTLDESFSVEGGRVRDHVRVRHPLQAFSPRYFDELSRKEDARLVSYAKLACVGARALAAPGGPKKLAPFVVGRLGDARVEIAAVSLDELVSFFKNPAKELVRKRLGFALGVEATHLLARESFELENLPRWLIGDEILSRVSSATEEERVLSLVRAKGVLPPYVLGDLELEKVGEAAQRIAAGAAIHRSGEALETVVIDDEIGGVHVSGELRGLWAGGQVIATYSKSGTGRELEAWIRHLFLCLAKPGGCHLGTNLVTRGDWGAELAAFRAVDDSRAILGDLIGLYLSGMERPLLFLPDISRAYREARMKGEDEARALAKAVRSISWEDPYVAIVFGDLRESLSENLAAFAETAERIFAPLDGHLEGR